jgi:hypothetical protein
MDMATPEEIKAERAEYEMRHVADARQNAATVAAIVRAGAETAEVVTGRDDGDGMPWLRAQLVFGNGLGADVVYGHISLGFATTYVTVYVYLLGANGVPVELASMNALTWINESAGYFYYNHFSAFDEYQLFRAGTIDHLPRLLAELSAARLEAVAV